MVNSYKNVIQYKTSFNNAKIKTRQMEPFRSVNNWAHTFSSLRYEESLFLSQKTHPSVNAAEKFGKKSSDRFLSFREDIFIEFF